MRFLSIPTNNQKDIFLLNKYISQGNPIFILFYMEGCPPCNQVRPEWKKLRNIFQQDKSNDIIVDIDQTLFSKIKYPMDKPSGFPCIRYLSKKSIQKKDEEYMNPNRSVDALIEWIKSKKTSTNKYKKTHRNKEKNTKGGIRYINKHHVLSEFSTFLEFLQNSSVEYKRKGSYGYVFLVQKNPNYESLYRYTTEEKYGEPVTQMIIKIVIIENSKEESDFKKEVNNQINIFKKTNSFLQPLCPAIAFANIIQPYQISSFLENSLLKDRDPEFINFRSLRRILISKCRNNPTFSLGVIAMEFAEKFETLYDEDENEDENEDEQGDAYHEFEALGVKKNEIYIYMSLFLLCKLVTETGYTQGDFHKGNIMIQKNSTTYFKGLHGAPLLIDFGNSSKIPEPILSSMKRDISSKNYTKVLEQLCTLSGFEKEIEDGKINFFLLNTFNQYDWVCNCKTLMPNTNEILAKLEGLREKAIQDIIVKNQSRCGVSGCISRFFPRFFPLEDNRQTFQGIKEGGNKKGQKTRKKKRGKTQRMYFRK